VRSGSDCKPESFNPSVAAVQWEVSTPFLDRQQDAKDVSWLLFAILQGHPYPTAEETNEGGRRKRWKRFERRSLVGGSTPFADFPHILGLCPLPLFQQPGMKRVCIDLRGISNFLRLIGRGPAISRMKSEGDQRRPLRAVTLSANGGDPVPPGRFRTCLVGGRRSRPRSSSHQDSRTLRSRGERAHGYSRLAYGLCVRDHSALVSL